MWELLGWRGICSVVDGRRCYTVGPQRKQVITERAGMWSNLEFKPDAISF